MSVQHDRVESDAPAAPDAPPVDGSGVAGPGSAAAPPSLLTRLRDAGFPEAPAAPAPRWWVVALAAVAAVLYQSFRTPGVGAWDTVWAEDGANFLGDAVNKGPIDALATSVNGYYLFIPRLFAEITTLFPVSWWAVINTSFAIAATCVLAGIVYQCGAGHFSHPAARLALAAPIALQWVSNGESVNNVATLQFPALYTLFWVLVYVARGRLGKIGGPIVAGAVALTTVLVLALAPLALIRLVLRRDRGSLWLAVATVGGVLVQLVGLATGRASRNGIGETTPDLQWVAEQFRSVAVPTAFLGERVFKTITDHPDVWVVAWGLIAVALLLTLWKPIRPAWGLAALAFGFAFVLLAEEIVAMGSLPNRYLVAPTGLLVTAVVALLRPAAAVPTGEPPGDRPEGRSGARRSPLAFAPLVAFMVLIVSVAVVNYRVPHKNRTPFTPSWTDQVTVLSQECRANPDLGSVIVLSGPRRMPYAKVNVPCERLR